MYIFLLLFLFSSFFFVSYIYHGCALSFIYLDTYSHFGLEFPVNL